MDRDADLFKLIYVHYDLLALFLNFTMDDFTQYCIAGILCRANESGYTGLRKICKSSACLEKILSFAVNNNYLQDDIINALFIPCENGKTALRRISINALDCLPDLLGFVKTPEHKQLLVAALCDGRDDCLPAVFSVAEFATSKVLRGMLSYIETEIQRKMLVNAVLRCRDDTKFPQEKRLALVIEILTTLKSVRESSQVEACCQGQESSSGEVRSDLFAC